MTINFYICNCDNRVVDKTNYLTSQTSMNCSIYNQTGIMHPSLVLTYSPAIVNYNYFEIPDWKRFYYITGMEVMSGQRIVVSGSEDVLHSNHEKIMELDAYVQRTESNKINKLIVDSKIPSQANRHCKTLSFSAHPFNATDTSPVYLLTVVGGVTST